MSVPFALAALLAATPGQAASYGVRTAEIPECPKHLDGFRLEVGWAAAATQAEALETARDNARNQLITSLCSGYDETRCAAVKRHAVSWGEGHWEPPERKRDDGNACAVVAIENRFADLIEQEHASFDQGLQSLAAQVKSKTGDTLLSLEPITWDSGCLAGELGRTLSGRLRSLLTGLRLLEAHESERQALQVLVDLTPGKQQVQLNGRLREPDKAGTLALGGFSFSADLFAVDAEEEGACRGNAQLDLQDDEKLGEGGLRVELVLPTHDGALCEGEAVSAGLSVNRQARVQVFTVLRDGSAYLVWPPPGEDGLVAESASLGEFHAAYAEDMGDERLVAIAVPASQHFAMSEGWTGFCRVEGSFGARVYPSTAAVGTATYQVLPVGSEGCSGEPHRQSVEALKRAPVCH